MAEENYINDGGELGFNLENSEKNEVYQATPENQETEMLETKYAQEFEKTKLNLIKDNPFDANLKLLATTQFAKYLQTGDTDGPVFMEVMLTDKCNMRCRWCITDHRIAHTEGNSTIGNKPFYQLEISSLKSFLRDFAMMGGKAVTFSGGGEPTLYPYFEEAVIAAKENRLDVGLMTNGLYPMKYNEIIGNKVTWVRISVDTLDKKNYEKQKGVNGESLEIIKRNIRELTKPQYGVRVGLNCNVGDYLSVEEAVRLVEFLDEVPDLSYVQFRPILPRFWKAGEKLEFNAPVWDYLESVRNNPRVILSDDKRLDVLEKTSFAFDKCRAHIFQPILDADGNVKVCSYHSERDDLSFGNIDKKSFQEIWASEQRRKAIKVVWSLNYRKECQMCCKLSENNTLLYQILKAKKRSDINFL